MLGMAALFLVNSCQKQELQPDPVLKLNVSVVTVGQDGGPRSVVYQVENPVEGTEVSASTAESWIQDLTVLRSQASLSMWRLILEAKERVWSRFRTAEPRMSLSP